MNSLVYKLKEAEVGVKCGSQVSPVLLYADDAVILAEDERSMRRGLDTLAEWCSEWAVEINVEKCGVMHVRKKGVKRTEVKFYVGSDEVKVVEEYKYLGCVVNEHLQSARMAEERAKAGTRALGDWLRRCRATVGEVKGSTFMKLMEILRKKGTHLCIEFTVVVYCHCAGRPFRRIPLLISSTGPTASKSHQATTYL